MSATRANWFTDELDEAIEQGDDPFSAPIEELGEAIDLSDPEGRLQARLTEVVTRLNTLDRMGMHCSIMEAGATSCLACPFSAHNDEENPMKLLCRVGREQDRVVTELISLQHGAPQWDPPA